MDLLRTAAGTPLDLADPVTVAVRSSGRHVARYHRRFESEALLRLLDGPDAAAELFGDRIFKSDATTTVRRVSLDGRRFVVKRYNTKNAWHALRRLLRRSRAANCWHFAHELPAAGIEVAPPVAMIEQRLGPLRGVSWYVSAYVDGDVCLERLRADPDRPDVAEIAEHLVRTLNLLAEHRLAHGDMKATNIVLRGTRPVMLDLDATRRYHSRLAHRRARARDRARFMKNWRGVPYLEALFEERLRIPEPG
jgi:tRNA A-37 threonylcarbamoyl transferase component Bud32